MKKIMSLILSLALLVCGVSALAEGQNETALSKIDMTQWQYNAENDVYWQVGLAYAATPADSS